MYIHKNLLLNIPFVKIHLYNVFDPKFFSHRIICPIMYMNSNFCEALKICDKLIFTFFFVRALSQSIKHFSNLQSLHRHVGV